MKYAFVNIIRDPVDHLISQWYFQQIGTDFSKDERSKTTGNVQIIADEPLVLPIVELKMPVGHFGGNRQCWQIHDFLSVGFVTTLYRHHIDTLAKI